MKTLITIIIAGLVLSTTTAYARSSVPEEAVVYTVSYKAVGQTYVSHDRGKRISVEVLADHSSPDLICKSYRYKIEKPKRKEEGYEIESSAEGAICNFSEGWTILGSRKHDKILQNAKRNNKVADNPCRGNEQIRSESKVAKEARKQAKNLERGRDVSITPVVAEALIGAFLVDRRSSTNCRR